MTRIPSQPIYNYLRYPAYKQCVIDMVADGQILEWLKPMRGNLTKPVYITQPFFEYIKKAIPSFKNVWEEVKIAHNHQAGIITTAEFSNLQADNLRTSSSAVWSISDGMVTVAMFMTYNGFSCAAAMAQTSIEDPTEYNIYICPKFNDETKKTYKGMIKTLTGALMGYLCLRRFAEVEVVELKHGKKVKQGKDEYTVQGNTDFEIMDSKWFREICSDEEFFVSGYMAIRYKKGKDKQIHPVLVPVRPYTKKGYHRKAIIEKTEEE